MKNIFRIAINLLFVLAIFISKADERSSNDFASTTLAQMSSTIKKMGSYKVEFSLSMGQQAVVGSYVVDGNSYYISLDGVEVYCDGVVRYEVNRELGEIVVDEVNSESYNLLDNPTRSFDFLASEFKSSILTEDSNQIVIRLDPLSDNIPFGHLILAINLETKLPKSIIYDMSGDKIQVDIKGFTTSLLPLKLFVPTHYSDYEWIDFRK